MGKINVKSQTKLKKIITLLLSMLLVLSCISYKNSTFVYAEEDVDNTQDTTNVENENENEEIALQQDGESLELAEDKNTSEILNTPLTKNDNENTGLRSDWLHYSIDLIWDIADDDQKINQTVVATNSTTELYPKYKFTTTMSSE